MVFRDAAYFFGRTNPCTKLRRTRLLLVFTTILKKGVKKAAKAIGVVLRRSMISYILNVKVGL